VCFLPAGVVEGVKSARVHVVLSLVGSWGRTRAEEEVHVVNDEIGQWQSDRVLKFGWTSVKSPSISISEPNLSFGWLSFQKVGSCQAGEKCQVPHIGCGPASSDLKGTGLPSGVSVSFWSLFLMAAIMEDQMPLSIHCPLRKSLTKCYRTD
jgi:hypothetical protein